MPGLTSSDQKCFSIALILLNLISVIIVCLMIYGAYEIERSFSPISNEKMIGQISEDWKQVPFVDITISTRPCEEIKD